MTTSRPEGASGPERTCVGCRRRRPVSDLERVVRTGEGTLAIGRTLPGRGAWFCRGSLECLELAERRRGFARSLRASVAPGAVADLRRSLVDRSEG